MISFSRSRPQHSGLAVYVYAFDPVVQFDVVAQSEEGRYPDRNTTRLAHHMAQHATSKLQVVTGSLEETEGSCTAIGLLTTTKEAGSGRSGLLVVFAVEAPRTISADLRVWLLEQSYYAMMSSYAVQSLDSVIAALQAEQREGMERLNSRLAQMVGWVNFIVSQGMVFSFRGRFDEDFYGPAIRAVINGQEHSGRTQELEIVDTSTDAGLARQGYRACWAVQNILLFSKDL